MAESSMISCYYALYRGDSVSYSLHPSVIVSTLPYKAADTSKTTQNEEDALASSCEYAVDLDVLRSLYQHHPRALVILVTSASKRGALAEGKSLFAERSYRYQSQQGYHFQDEEEQAFFTSDEVASRTCQVMLDARESAEGHEGQNKLSMSPAYAAALLRQHRWLASVHKATAGFCTAQHVVAMLLTLPPSPQSGGDTVAVIGEGRENFFSMDPAYISQLVSECNWMGDTECVEVVLPRLWKALSSEYIAAATATARGAACDVSATGHCHVDADDLEVGISLQSVLPSGCSSQGCSDYLVLATSALDDTMRSSSFLGSLLASLERTGPAGSSRDRVYVNIAGNERTPLSPSPQQATKHVCTGNHQKGVAEKMVEELCSVDDMCALWTWCAQILADLQVERHRQDIARHLLSTYSTSSPSAGSGKRCVEAARAVNVVLVLQPPEVLSVRAAGVLDYVRHNATFYGVTIHICVVRPAQGVACAYSFSELSTLASIGQGGSLVAFDLEHCDMDEDTETLVGQWRRRTHLQTLACIALPTLTQGNEAPPQRAEDDALLSSAPLVAHCCLTASSSNNKNESSTPFISSFSLYLLHCGSLLEGFIHPIYARYTLPHHARLDLLQQRHKGSESGVGLFAVAYSQAHSQFITTVLGHVKVVNVSEGSTALSPLRALSTLSERTWWGGFLWVHRVLSSTLKRRQYQLQQELQSGLSAGDAAAELSGGLLAATQHACDMEEALLGQWSHVSFHPSSVTSASMRSSSLLQASARWTASAPRHLVDWISRYLDTRCPPSPEPEEEQEAEEMMTELFLRVWAGALVRYEASLGPGGITVASGSDEDVKGGASLTSLPQRGSSARTHSHGSLISGSSAHEQHPYNPSSSSPIRSLSARPPLPTVPMSSSRQFAVPIANSDQGGDVSGSQDDLRPFAQICNTPSIPITTPHAEPPSTMNAHEESKEETAVAASLHLPGSPLSAVSGIPNDRDIHEGATASPDSSALPMASSATRNRFVTVIDNPAAVPSLRGSSRARQLNVWIPNEDVNNGTLTGTSDITARDSGNEVNSAEMLASASEDVSLVNVTVATEVMESPVYLLRNSSVGAGKWASTSPNSSSAAKERAVAVDATVEATVDLRWSCFMTRDAPPHAVSWVSLLSPQLAFTPFPTSRLLRAVHFTDDASSTSFGESAIMGEVKVELRTALRFRDPQKQHVPLVTAAIALLEVDSLSGALTLVDIKLVNPSILAHVSATETGSVNVVDATAEALTQTVRFSQVRRGHQLCVVYAGLSRNPRDRIEKQDILFMDGIGFATPPAQKSPLSTLRVMQSGSDSLTVHWVGGGAVKLVVTPLGSAVGPHMARTRNPSSVTSSCISSPLLSRVFVAERSPARLDMLHPSTVYHIRAIPHHGVWRREGASLLAVRSGRDGPLPLPVALSLIADAAAPEALGLTCSVPSADLLVVEEASARWGRGGLEAQRWMNLRGNDDGAVKDGAPWIYFRCSYPINVFTLEIERQAELLSQDFFDYLSKASSSKTDKHGTSTTIALRASITPHWGRPAQSSVSSIIAITHEEESGDVNLRYLHAFVEAGAEISLSVSFTVDLTVAPVARIPPDSMGSLHHTVVPPLRPLQIFTTEAAALIDICVGPFHVTSADVEALHVEESTALLRWRGTSPMYRVRLSPAPSAHTAGLPSFSQEQGRDESGDGWVEYVVVSSVSAAKEKVSSVSTGWGRETQLSLRGLKAATLYTATVYCDRGDTNSQMPPHVVFVTRPEAPSAEAVVACFNSHARQLFTKVRSPNPLQASLMAQENTSFGGVPHVRSRLLLLTVQPLRITLETPIAALAAGTLGGAAHTGEGTEELLRERVVECRTVPVATPIVLSFVEECALVRTSATAENAVGQDVQVERHIVRSHAHELYVLSNVRCRHIGSTGQEAYLQQSRSSGAATPLIDIAWTCGSSDEVQVCLNGKPYAVTQNSCIAFSSLEMLEAAAAGDGDFDCKTLGNEEGVLGLWWRGAVALSFTGPHLVHEVAASYIVPPPPSLPAETCVIHTFESYAVVYIASAYLRNLCTAACCRTADCVLGESATRIEPFVSFSVCVQAEFYDGSTGPLVQHTLRAGASSSLSAIIDDVMQVPLPPHRRTQTTLRLWLSVCEMPRTVASTETVLDNSSDDPLLYIPQSSSEQVFVSVAPVHPLKDLRVERLEPTLAELAWSPATESTFPAARGVRYDITIIEATRVEGESAEVFCSENEKSKSPGYRTITVPVVSATSTTVQNLKPATPYTIIVRGASLGDHIAELHLVTPSSIPDTALHALLSSLQCTSSHRSAVGKVVPSPQQQLAPDSSSCRVNMNSTAVHALLAPCEVVNWAVHRPKGSNGPLPASVVASQAWRKIHQREEQKNGKDQQSVTGQQSIATVSAEEAVGPLSTAHNVTVTTHTNVALVAPSGRLIRQWSNTSRVGRGIEEGSDGGLEVDAVWDALSCVGGWPHLELVGGCTSSGGGGERAESMHLVTHGCHSVAVIPSASAAVRVDLLGNARTLYVSRTSCRLTWEGSCEHYRVTWTTGFSSVIHSTVVSLPMGSSQRSGRCDAHHWGLVESQDLKQQQQQQMPRFIELCFAAPQEDSVPVLFVAIEAAHGLSSRLSIAVVLPPAPRVPLVLHQTAEKVTLCFPLRQREEEACKGLMHARWELLASPHASSSSALLPTRVVALTASSSALLRLFQGREGMSVFEVWRGGCTQEGETADEEATSVEVKGTYTVVNANAEKWLCRLDELALHAHILSRAESKKKEEGECQEIYCPQGTFVPTQNVVWLDRVITVKAPVRLPLMYTLRNLCMGAFTEQQRLIALDSASAMGTADGGEHATQDECTQTRLRSGARGRLSSAAVSATAALLHFGTVASEDAATAHELARLAQLTCSGVPLLSSTLTWESTDSAFTVDVFGPYEQQWRSVTDRTAPVSFGTQFSRDDDLAEVCDLLTRHTSTSTAQDRPYNAPALTVAAQEACRHEIHHYRHTPSLETVPRRRTYYIQQRTCAQDASTLAQASSAWQSGGREEVAFVLQGIVPGAFYRVQVTGLRCGDAVLRTQFISPPSKLAQSIRLERHVDGRVTVFARYYNSHAGAILANEQQMRGKPRTEGEDDEDNPLQAVVIGDEDEQLQQKVLWIAPGIACEAEARVLVRDRAGNLLLDQCTYQSSDMLEVAEEEYQVDTEERERSFRHVVECEPFTIDTCGIGKGGVSLSVRTTMDIVVVLQDTPCKQKQQQQAALRRLLEVDVWGALPYLSFPCASPVSSSPAAAAVSSSMATAHLATEVALCSVPGLPQLARPRLVARSGYTARLTWEWQDANGVRYFGTETGEKRLPRFRVTFRPTRDSDGAGTRTVVVVDACMVTLTLLKPATLYEMHVEALEEYSNCRGKALRLPVAGRISAAGAASAVDGASSAYAITIYKQTQEVLGALVTLRAHSRHGSLLSVEDAALDHSAGAIGCLLTFLTGPEEAGEEAQEGVESEQRKPKATPAVAMVRLPGAVALSVDPHLVASSTAPGEDFKRIILQTPPAVPRSPLVVEFRAVLVLPSWTLYVPSAILTWSNGQDRATEGNSSSSAATALRKQARWAQGLWRALQLSSTAAEHGLTDVDGDALRVLPFPGPIVTTAAPGGEDGGLRRRHMHVIQHLAAGASKKRGIGKALKDAVQGLPEAVVKIPVEEPTALTDYAEDRATIFVLDCVQVLEVRTRVGQEQRADGDLAVSVRPPMHVQPLQPVQQLTLRCHPVRARGVREDGEEDEGGRADLSSTSGSAMSNASAAAASNATIYKIDVQWKWSCEAAVGPAARVNAIRAAIGAPCSGACGGVVVCERVSAAYIAWLTQQSGHTAPDSSSNLQGQGTPVQRVPVTNGACHAQLTGLAPASLYRVFVSEVVYAGCVPCLPGRSTMVLSPPEPPGLPALRYSLCSVARDRSPRTSSTKKRTNSVGLMDESGKTHHEKQGGEVAQAEGAVGSKRLVATFELAPMQRTVQGLLLVQWAVLLCEEEVDVALCVDAKDYLLAARTAAAAAACSSARSSKGQSHPFIFSNTSAENKLVAALTLRPRQHYSLALFNAIGLSCHATLERTSHVAESIDSCGGGGEASVAFSRPVVVELRNTSPSPVSALAQQNHVKARMQALRRLTIRPECLTLLARRSSSIRIAWEIAYPRTRMSAAELQQFLSAGLLVVEVTTTWADTIAAVRTNSARAARNVELGGEEEAVAAKRVGVKAEEAIAFYRENVEPSFAKETSADKTPRTTTEYVYVKVKDHQVGKCEHHDAESGSLSQSCLTYEYEFLCPTYAAAHAAYAFRVRCLPEGMAAEATYPVTQGGLEAWSDPLRLNPVTVPGPVQRVQVASRTASSLAICWKDAQTDVMSGLQYIVRCRALPGEKERGEASGSEDSTSLHDDEEKEKQVEEVREVTVRGSTNTAVAGLSSGTTYRVEVIPANLFGERCEELNATVTARTL